jgi:hypothetical protein
MMLFTKIFSRMIVMLLDLRQDDATKERAKGGKNYVQSKQINYVMRPISPVVESIGKMHEILGGARFALS